MKIDTGKYIFDFYEPSKGLVLLSITTRYPDGSLVTAGSVRLKLPWYMLSSQLQEVQVVEGKRSSGQVGVYVNVRNSSTHGWFLYVLEEAQALSGEMEPAMSKVSK